MICFLIDQQLRDNPNMNVICFLFASGHIDTPNSKLHIIHKITIDEPKAV